MIDKDALNAAMQIAREMSVLREGRFEVFKFTDAEFTEVCAQFGIYVPPKPEIGVHTHTIYGIYFSYDLRAFQARQLPRGYRVGVPLQILQTFEVVGEEVNAD